jgi:hypothetical protein
MHKRMGGHGSEVLFIGTMLGLEMLGACEAI